MRRAQVPVPGDAGSPGGIDRVDMNATGELLHGTASDSRPVQLGTRESLLVDLTEAVRHEARTSVLVIFGLAGFRGLVEHRGRPEGQALLAELSARLEHALGRAGACYRPREDEFALLCDASHPDLDSLLDRAVAALCDGGSPVSVTAAFGRVVVPAEASDPIAALRLADTRLAAAQPGREPREQRRHLRPVAPGDLPPGPEGEVAPIGPLAAMHAEMLEASACALRKWRIDRLLDIADTLTVLADAARIDDRQTGALQGMPRDPARIPLLAKELGLKLTALRVLGGPDVPAAKVLAEETHPRGVNTGVRVLAALDEIGEALAAA
jgi:GGDEF domain-containing protein